MTTGEATVPLIGMVPGGLTTAFFHISMAYMVMVMALFGITGKVGIIPSSSQR